MMVRKMGRDAARPIGSEQHTTTGNDHATRHDGNTLPGADAMSWRALLWVMQLPTMTPAQRAVLSKLADHASRDGGRAYVGVETIATWAGLTPRHVRRVLGELIGQGAISVEGSNGRQGGAASTTYRVRIPSAFSPEDGAAVPNGSDALGGRTFEAAGGRTFEAGGRTFETLTPDIMSSDPKTQPKCNYQSLRSWRPEGRLGPAAARKIIWSEGVRLVQDLTGRRERQARGFVGELVRLAGPRHPGQVIEALQAAADLRPADAAAYLVAACSPDARLTETDRMRRDWNLPSFGDEAYAIIYGAAAA